MELLLSGLPLIYWLYLIDPFTRRPLKRNYLRLYKDSKYLTINLILSAALITLKIYIIRDGENKSVIDSSLPLLFILTSLLLIKVSVYKQNRYFKFVQRGDLIKWNSLDMLFTCILFLIPFIVSIYLDYKLNKLWSS